MKRDIEHLSEEYLRQQDKLQKKQTRLLKKRTVIILFALLMISTAVMLFSGYQAFINISTVERNRDTTRYEDILTEVEQSNWASKAVQTGEAVFQLNLSIPVMAETSRAEIRLVNPPYSDFICQVSIREEESSLVIYESEELIPGTLLQYASLTETLAIGEYNAIVVFTFIDGRGEIQGSYDVEVILEVEEQGNENHLINPYEVQEEIRDTDEMPENGIEAVE